jgi:hypothetical protein
MKHWLASALSLMIGFGLAGSVWADDEPSPGGNPPSSKGSPPPAKGKGRMDPEALFKRLNTSGDGKLTREQFAKLGEVMKGKAGDRFKENAKAMDKMFNNLDTNGDGYLSLEEFKQFGQARKKKGG